MSTSTTTRLAIAIGTLTLFGSWHSEAAAGGEEPGVVVSRLLVAKDVREREPIGAGTEFSIADTPQLYAFVDVDNPTAQPTEIVVSWIDVATGKVLRFYTLEIGAPKRWRTWARTVALKRAGTFEVVVTDVSGNELARTPFTVKE